MKNKEIINNLFQEFGTPAIYAGEIEGPTVTSYLIKYKGIKTTKTLRKLVDELSKRLNGAPIRYVDRVLNTSSSGYEIPNKERATLSYEECFRALEGPSTSIPLGKDVVGQYRELDVTKAPHILISGTSGSGKSVLLNSIITSLIARNDPKVLQLLLIDPKRVEMNRYKNIPHLYLPIINDPEEARTTLLNLIDVMNDRYQAFEEADYSCSLDEYNDWARKNNKPTMPRVIIIIDEFADLAYGCKDIHTPLLSLLQKSRAAGFNIIVSTQRPTTDVITGSIKANMPTRIALTAASYVDSMTVLDDGDATDLLGSGDYLIKTPLIDYKHPVRIQAPYITSQDIKNVVEPLRKEPPKSSDNNNPEYDKIKAWALEQDYVSMSKIQRECSVGFNRAGKYLAQLQKDGIVSLEEAGRRGYKVIR